MNTENIGLRKAVALLLAAGSLAGSPAASRAESNALLQDFEALLSGMIATEEETASGNHIMTIQGEIQLLDSMVGGELTLSLEGHHGQPEGTLQSPEQLATPECVPASGQGKLTTLSGVIRFSHAGTVCLNVPGIKKPATHLYTATYYVNGGTGDYKRTFGSGSLSGSFDSDVGNPDPTSKRVILKFDGAIRQ